VSEDLAAALPPAEDHIWLEVGKLHAAKRGFTLADLRAVASPVRRAGGRTRQKNT
jgi:hypothetical protein